MDSIPADHDAPVPRHRYAQSSALTLEDLLASTVISVAKRPQPIASAPSAIFVINSEDIRRAGAISLLEVLRMAPGVEVSVTPSGGFTASIRGLTGSQANKLLVLIDGQALNLSTEGGDVWNQEVIPLEAIERIEIVRGPGGAAWGGNALNGIINIITKHPVDTMGLKSTLRTDGKQYILDLGVGAQIGQGAARLYVSKRKLAEHVIGRQLSLRYDTDYDSNTAMTVSGTLQKGSSGLTLSQDFTTFTPARYSDSSLLVRIARALGTGSGWNVQGAWRREVRRELGAYTQNQAELSSSHYASYGRHNIVWGAELRILTYDFSWTVDGIVAPVSSDSSTASSALTFRGRAKERRFGIYAQDDFQVSEAVTLSFGVKVEHNSLAGVEIQPTARAIVDTAAGVFWISATKASRPPSFLEFNVSVNSPEFEMMVAGAQERAPLPKPEKVAVFEAGWRKSISHGASLDLAAYRNVYTNLYSQPILEQSVDSSGDQLNNIVRGNANAIGLEASIDVQAAERTRIKAAIAVGDLKTGLASDAVSGVRSATIKPAVQLSLRAQQELSANVELDAWLRHAESTSSLSPVHYTDVDLRLGWRASDRLEIAINGRNLLKARRAEISSSPLNAAWTGRDIVVQLSYRR